MTHVTENLKVPGISLSFEDRKALERSALAARVCGFCGACSDACPAGVAVQDILRFNAYLHDGQANEAIVHYRSLPPDKRGRACSGCGKCEALCPSRVPIRKLMKEAENALA